MRVKRKAPLTSALQSKARQSAPQSHKATQAKISSYHTLLKRKHQVQRELERDTDVKRAALLGEQLAAIEAELKALGGLESYQAASIQGQSRDRGGDSAKVFIAWLKELGYHELGSPLRLLEIGALTPDNYDSCAKWIENEPIDLHSQHPSITEQDFFERPVDSDQLFDLISCSLVLNFVPDPRQRGVMLDLIHHQLKPSTASLLFLVLPLPCLRNSRYLDTSTLLSLMKEAGYSLVKERWKPGAKVGYWLWSRVAKPDKPDERWRRKVQIHEGSKMNNFSITLP